MNYLDDNKLSIKEFYLNSSQRSLPIKIGSEIWHLINVPSDGFCLLYSFQTSFRSLYNRFLSLSEICQALVDQFRLKCIQKTLPYDFLIIDDQDSELISSADESIEPIFKFFLIRYFIHKYYKAFVLDYMPQLLSEYFNCDIKILSYTDHKFHTLHHFKNGSKLPINLLFCSEINHFMSLCNKDIKFEHEPNDILIDLTGNFYNRVVELFKKSNFNYYFNLSIILYLFKLKDMYLLNKKVEYYKCKPAKINFAGNRLTEIRLLSKLQDYVFENSKLTQRYTERFNGLPEIHAIENAKIGEFLHTIFLNFISNDDQIEVFMKLLLKLCSLKCLYCQIDLVFRTDEVCYLIKIPCFGVQVDLEMLRINLIIFKNNGSYRFEFLHEISDAIEMIINGPKSNISNFDKKKISKKSSVSDLFSKCVFK